MPREVATRSLRAIVSVKVLQFHVAILARSLGIPASHGCNRSAFGGISGTHLIVDGWRGEVIVEPSGMFCLSISVRYETTQFWRWILNR